MKTILLYICLTLSFSSNHFKNNNYIKLPNSTEKTTKIYDSLYVKLTVYWPNISQCDSTPLQTASLKTIDTNKVKSGRQKWVAISPNLHVRYGGSLKFGDTIKIHSKNKKIKGNWIVQDLSSPKNKNSIDILQMPGGYYGKLNSVKITYSNVL